MNSLILVLSLMLASQPETELSGLFEKAQAMVSSDIDASTKLFREVYHKSIERDSLQRAGLALYNIGSNLVSAGDFDSALVYIIEADDMFQELEYQRGLIQTNVLQGNIHNFLGNTQDAILFYHYALDYATLSLDSFSQARVLNNLGAAYNSAGRIQQALKTLDQGLKIATAIDNPVILGDINNNLATNYEALNDVDKAIYYGRKAAEYFRLGGDHEYEALALTNLAAYLLKEQEVDTDSVAYFLAKGKVILDSINSPSILTNYYRQLTFLNIVREAYPEAKLTADTCLRLLDTFPYLHGRAQIYDKLYLIYKKENNTSKALEYLEKFFSLKDSLVYDESNQQLQELEAKYQLVKKDALLANQELEISRKTGQRNLYLGITLALVAIGLFLYHRNKQKENQVALQREQIENLKKQQQIVALDHLLQGQEEERKRIAQDLHDGLGGLLSTVQVQVNNALRSLEGDAREDIALPQSASLISEACQEVRRIAHDMMPGALIKIGLFAAVSDLMDTYAFSSGIDIHFDAPDEEYQIADKKAISIYRIIQEIMNNLLKYSKANNFYLDLEIEKDTLRIIAQDDGVGFDKSDISTRSGLGLEGIRGRVEHMHGSYNIITKPGSGVRYELSIPGVIELNESTNAV